MGYSTSASSQFAAHKHKKSSRKVFPNHVFSGAAVACLVLGCAWNLYANVFGASIYPTVGGFDAPVIKRASVVAVRTPQPVTTNTLAALPEPAPEISAPASIALLDFQDRFGAAAPQSVEPARQVETPKLAVASAPVQTTVQAPVQAPKLASAASPVEAPKPKAVSPQPAPAQVAALAPASRAVENKPEKQTGTSVRDMAQRAKAAVMSIASGEKQTMVEKLWGKRELTSFLSYASADASVTGSISSTLSQNPMRGGSPPYDRQTAVYDISAKTVYLPDGTRLEAHSGLGSKMDDVRYAHVRMQGVTPPHIYELKPREALFHGVPALRLTPIGGEDKIFGRDGLLAHTYMLGSRGNSNGCVSFKDYYAFLNAYRNHGIRRLAVLAKVE